MSKNKIAFYLPNLEGGGAERAIVNLSNEFSERGFDVDLVLVNSIGPYLSEINHNVNVLNFKKKKVIHSLPALIKYILKNKPSILFSTLTHANLVAIVAKLISNSSVNLIISERNDIPEALRSSKIIKLLFTFLYKRANKIHVVSSGIANSLSAFYGIPKEKFYVIYTPHSLNKISDLATKMLSSEFSYILEQPYFIAVGRLEEIKGFSTLIKAFSNIRLDLNYKLFILGEGVSRKKLEQEISELGMSNSVILLGFIQNPFPFIKNSKLLILSSFSEGLPNVLIQAMALGVPIVSTNCKYGPSEILENGKWGRLVPVGDVKALEKAMIDAVNDKNHPNVKERAIYFSFENIFPMYLNLFELSNK